MSIVAAAPAWLASGVDAGGDALDALRDDAAIWLDGAAVDERELGERDAVGDAAAILEHLARGRLEPRRDLDLATTVTPGTPVRTSSCAADGARLARLRVERRRRRRRRGGRRGRRRRGRRRRHRCTRGRRSHVRAERLARTRRQRRESGTTIDPKSTPPVKRHLGGALTAPARGPRARPPATTGTAEPSRASRV